MKFTKKNVKKKVVLTGLFICVEKLTTVIDVVNFTINKFSLN